MTPIIKVRTIVTRRHLRQALLLALGAGLAANAANCGQSAPAVRSGDSMSAEQHREEAQREETIAAAHKAAWNPTAGVPGPARDPIDHDPNGYLYAAPDYNPTAWHLAEAEKHTAHAQQHEAAAAQLERFEESECRDFPPAVRATCPLFGPAEDVRDVPDGVSIRFAPTVRVDAVLSHMKCHLAYARAQGFAKAAACPLYMPGVSVRLASAPSTIEVTVSDHRSVAELRRNARDDIAIDTRPAGSDLKPSSAAAE